MGFKELLRPRKDNFLKLMIQQAAKTLEGMEALEEYMVTDSREAATRVSHAEKEADELRRILVDELNRVMVFRAIG